MSTCRISQILYDEKSINPVLLDFQNGILEPRDDAHIPCNLLEDSKRNRTVAVALQKLLYTGVVTKSNLYNNFIAIRKKKTNEMHLIAVDNALLSPVISKKRDLLDSTSPAKLMTVADLNRQFGSKRAKRQTEQFEKMRMNTENVKEDLEKTVADIEVDEADMVASVSDTNNGYKPLINRNASVVENVYDLETLAPMILLANLTEEVKATLASENKELSEKLCTFVYTEIVKLKCSASNKREEKCQLLLYIDCLVKIICSNSKIISCKRYNPCPYFPKLGHHILDHFTIMSNMGRCRPFSMRDKTMCYIIVLGAIACDYVLDLDVLSKDIKGGVKKLQEMSRILCLTPIKGKNLVELKLPLPPPLSLGPSPKKRAKK